MRHKIKSVQERLREPSLVVFLCAQLIMMFGLGPLLSISHGLPLNALVLMFVGILAFVVFVAQNAAAAAVIVAALMLGVSAMAMRQLDETVMTDWLGAAGGFIAVMTLSWVVAKIVLAPGRLGALRILGAVVLYLNIAILFFILFRLIAERVPGSFTNIPMLFSQRASFGDLMYFSVSTLTTVGYGDIAPVNPFARSLANMEAIMGQLYPAIILGRMITLYTPKTPPRS